MRIFPTTTSDMVVSKVSPETSVAHSSLWASTTVWITGGFVFLAISTLCRLIWPSGSPTLLSAVACAGTIGWLFLAMKTGMIRKSSNSKVKGSSDLRTFISDAGGFAVFMTLCFIASDHRAQLSQLLSGCFAGIVFALYEYGSGPSWAGISILLSAGPRSLSYWPDLRLC
jgi:hypothetical protein